MGGLKKAISGEYIKMKSLNNILIASDHAGFELKQQIITYLESLKYNITDLGTNSSESVDYPDYGYKLAEKISSDSIGIAICGSGIGISIALNRNSKIRAALCHDEMHAQLSRQHNNANVLALGARFITFSTAVSIVNKFLCTEFEGGRHQTRVDKLTNYNA